jgi:hypothetical protein
MWRQALRSFKMLVNFYQTVGHHIPEDDNLQFSSNKEKVIIKACFIRNAAVFPEGVSLLIIN